MLYNEKVMRSSCLKGKIEQRGSIDGDFPNFQ